MPTKHSLLALPAILMLGLVTMTGAELCAQQVPENLYYRFNEASGNSTANSASPGVGLATVNFGSGLPVWVTPGRLGASAMTFTSPSSIFSTGWTFPALPTTQSWTIEFWVRTSVSTHYIFGDGTGSLRCWIGTGRCYLFSVGGTIPINDFSTLATTLANGQWNHVAFVYDATVPQGLVYLNGTLDRTIGGTAAPSAPNFVVGGRTPTDTSYLKGDLDEFRFWMTARTAAEISANMSQELFLGPQLAVSATAGTAQSVFANAQGPGGNGIEAGTFTIASNSQSPNSVLTSIDIQATGTGNDSTAFTEVSLFRDDTSGTNPGVFDAGDIAIGSPSVFTADDGTITFTVPTGEQAYNPSETRTFFVVAKLTGTATPGQTFSFTVSDIAVATGLKNVPPNSTMAGLVIDTPQFVFTDTSLTTVEKVFLTFSEVCQIFTIGYPNGPDDKPASLTVNSLGTADESTDLVSVQLWWDSNNDAAFNNGLDMLVNSQVFTQDNGSVVFDLSSLPDFQPGQTRRFFVVYELNANADDLETFQCYVNAMGAAPLGGTPVGLPSPSANGTPGLEVSAAILFGIMNGPAAPAMVDSNAGATGNGVLLADVTLKALPGGDWGITSLLFNAGGTGNHNFAYSELALHEDDNNNGLWDGPTTDSLAAPTAPGFVANSAGFDLILSTLLGGMERRFFLVARLNGTAASGATFGARLTGVVPGITPPGGSQSGFPTPASTALVIDVPVLSVANSPLQPDPSTHAAGTPGNVVAASFRLNALNGATTVSGIAFTTGGTGDWSTDVDATSGVQVYHDNGDGVFGTGDNMLDQAGGAAVVTTSFNLPLSTGEIADLWVVIGLTATAGQGVAATPETFSVAIAGASDVTASAPVAFGMPAPAGASIGAIEFNVSTFDPTTAQSGGGQSITISGSGFMAPFTVTIGGAVCPGTAVIAGGTQVTGLTVPPGFGTALPIIVHSGDLPAQTLTQSFTYTAPKDTDPPKSDDGGSCSAGTVPAWPVVAAIALLAAAVAYRRRTA
jgi:hypothetical protein